MSQRGLLGVGIGAIVASMLIGVVVWASGSWGAGNGISMLGRPAAADGRSISIDQAQSSVQSFLDRTGDKDLQIDELMEFDRNFYALVKEKSTGVGAFELLVSKATGGVAFEPGPDMMWNTKYSTMGGGMAAHPMMGAASLRIGIADASMPVSPEEATGIAQGWLDASFPGDSAGTPDAFYGYYTFHFERNGKIAGMLSVNGYSGQVWFHTWHGGFLQVRELGA